MSDTLTCPETDPAPEARASVDATSFHVTLCISDLDRSVRFYERLFNQPPAMYHGNYARFETAQPSVVLVLYASARPSGGALSHVGLRCGTSAELVEIQQRLESAGIDTQCQEGVECCYSRQTKFWVSDPDAVLWELYILEQDTEHSGFEDPPAPKTATVSHATWMHRLTEPLPDRIPHADETLDEVRLEGTFNVPIGTLRRTSLLAEARRALRPGGRIVVHGLVSDRPFPGKPDLPGLASLVRHVPVENEVNEALQQAGFEGLFYETLSDVNCIRVPGIDLRHCLLVGRRPLFQSEPDSVDVVYRGPFEQARDDFGNVYRRGERTTVKAVAADGLKNGPAARPVCVSGGSWINVVNGSDLLQGLDPRAKLSFRHFLHLLPAERLMTKLCT